MNNPVPPDDDPKVDERRSLPRRMLNRLEVDRATFYGVATRYWKFLAGPITALLIVKFFTPEVQGFFYAFSGVIVLQAFFELAFPQAIITHASHQWSRLQLTESGEIAGDVDSKSRLIDLFRTSCKVFLGLALAFGVFAALFGLWLFSDDEAADALAWRAPWLTLVALSVATFALVPVLALLEGCDQVREVFKMQLFREVIGNLVVWGSIAYGMELWVPVLAMFARLACELGFLWHRFGSFLRAFWHPPQAARMNWRREIWPFQSRLIIKGLFSFFNADVMLLVVFRAQNSAVAGQFGLTWTVLSAVRAACSAWVRSRVPKLGALASQKDYSEMDRIFFRVSSISLVIMVLISTLVGIVVAVMQWMQWAIADRLLGLGPTALLAAGCWAALAMEFQWVYLHTHGKSPYLGLTLIGNLLSGVLIISLGFAFGVLGVSAAFAFMHMLVFLPMSTWGFVHLRRTWHQQVDRDGGEATTTGLAT